ncbi:FkbM family methyltransferase [Frigidibacter sp. SD6-1]|uniref:FkbM family methyltransferase n=1 Tax=Frigidibacter sp. SD6-1 TaxID=3032581 RepID=UPI0024DF9DFC|nr:FkbM family methyltransferase [Frigidibacter sp. SD6-1]
MTTRNATEAQPSLAAINTRYGMFYVPDNSDIIANSLREYGEWAQIELDMLCQFIADGDILIDGGACFGTHARAFSQKVGVRGEVICFEPSPANRSVLEKNVAAAAIHNIKIRSEALGEQAGYGRLIEAPDGNAGGTHLESEAHEGPVVLVRLDDAGPKSVQFVKLDLEGAELAALKGATRILAEDRPVVFCEVLGIHGGSDLLRFMQGHGYFCCGIHSPAFNPSNFNGSARDIFFDGTECGLLFLPSEAADKYRDRIEALALPLIETVDDLALLMLQQPQYSRERLPRESAARRLPMPLAPIDAMRANAELAEIRTVLDARADEAKTLTQQLADSRAALDARAAEAKTLTQQLADSRAEFQSVNSDYARRLGMARTELDELHGLYEQWREQHAAAIKLARKVRKLPFSLFFRVSRRYRRSTRNLLRSVNMPDMAQKSLSQLRHIFNAALGRADAIPVSATSLTQNDRAARIRTITSSIGLAVLAPPPDIHETVLKDNAIADILARGRERVIVSLSHDNYLDVMGGTQVCIRIEASRAAPAGMDYLNIHPVRTCNALLPEAEVNTSTYRLVLNGEVLGTARYADMIAAIESRAATGQKFRFVVHHLMGHSPEAVAQLIEASGDNRCCYWLHDFFSACQSYTLMRNAISYCGGPDLASPACGVCVFGQARPRHTERLRHFFDRIAVTALAPSQVAADIWTRTCGYRLHDLIVQPHMVLEATERAKPLPVLGGADDAPIKVAYLGAPVAHKGWNEFERLVTDHARSKLLEFHYFGSYTADLDVIKHHVEVSAAQPDAMTRALEAAGIDLVLHFARWPETFSLTTAEALASQAYVVTQSQSGNVAALVQSTGRGAVLESEEALASWLYSADCRDLVLQARERRRSEVLDVHYSEMAIPALTGLYLP